MGKNTFQGGEVAVVTEPNTAEINSNTDTLFSGESQQSKKTSIPIYSTSFLHINTLSLVHREFNSMKIFRKGMSYFHCSSVKLTQAGISSSLLNFLPLCLLMFLFSSSSAFTPCLPSSIA